MGIYNSEVNNVVLFMRSPAIPKRVWKLIFYIYCPFQIAIHYARFIADVKKWMGSGRSSRFKPCAGDRFVDKETGGFWPASFFRAIEREEFGD